MDLHISCGGEVVTRMDRAYPPLRVSSCARCGAESETEIAGPFVLVREEIPRYMRDVLAAMTRAGIPSHPPFEPPERDHDRERAGP